MRDCYNQTQLYAMKLRILRGEDVDLKRVELRGGDWLNWEIQGLDSPTLIDSILNILKPQHWDLTNEKLDGVRLDTGNIRTRIRNHGPVRDGKERRPRLPHFTTGLAGLQVEKQVPSFSSTLGA